MITIVIAADICPIERNRPYFEAGDAEALFGDLLPELTRADLSIANLECPLIEKRTPIRKTGPVFGEPSACINGIRNAGLNVLSLANNHVMDHGPEGLRNTLRVCREAGIATVGAGESLEAAARLLVREVGGLRVGILGLAEHEFAVATPGAGGANPLDLIEFVRGVSAHRAACDYLIVLLHGAHEHYDLPSPRIKQTCRFMVERGANAVLVQHPHRLCGYERYRDAVIGYGQGALILDEKIFRDLAPFHEGYLARLAIAADLTTALDIVPFRQSEARPGARRMAPDAARAVRAALDAKSSAIQDDAYLRARWLEFCRTNRHGYVSTLLGHHRLLEKLNARGLLTRCLYGRNALLGARNVVCCETHREIIETILTEGL